MLRIKIINEKYYPQVFCTLFVFLLIASLQAFGQIKKVHTIDTVNNTYGGLFVTPKYIYFSGSYQDNGTVLWRTDGTEQGTTMLLNTPNGKVNVSNSTFTSCVYDSVNNKLYFLGYEKSTGHELWVTDGTESGTKLVKDLTPKMLNPPNGPASTDIYSMWLENDYLFLLYRGSGDYNQKFPLLLSRLNIQNNNVDTLSIFPIATYTNIGVKSLQKGKVLQTNNMLYYLNKNNAINDSISLNFRFNFTITPSNEGILYMNLYDSTIVGYSYWSTDGTRNGTTRLFNAYQSTEILSITQQSVYYMTSNNFGSYGRIYFCVYHISTAIIDTILQTEIMTWVRAFHLGNAGQRIIVAIEAGQYGIEPWYWDITTNEIRLLKDINPLFYNSSITINYSNIVTVKNNRRLYFFADDATHGKELWETDGTEAGTRLVQDLNPGGGWTMPIFASGDSNQCYFTAWNGKNKSALYRYVYPTSTTSAGEQSQEQPVESRACFRNGLLTIIFNKPWAFGVSSNVQVYDYRGNQFSATFISTSELTVTLAISQNLAQGVYFARIRRDKDIIFLPFFIVAP